MDSLLPALYLLGLYCAYGAGSLFLRSRAAQSQHPPRSLHLPQATFFLLLAVAVPSTLQFFYPALLPALQRDYARFLRGEWWRIVTPLFAQDGGVSGTIFNLVSLFLVGGVAEQLWGRRRMLGIFFFGGIVGEIAGFAWQPIGAGNSIGNFSLAASVAVACLTRQPPRAVQIAAILVLAADVGLVALRDIHGAAALAGAILALALSRGWQSRRLPSE